MSNSLALATVSSALRRQVLSAAVAAVSSATVRLGTPTAALADDDDALVNIHLYRVEPNTSHANTHFPNRTSGGRSLGPARLALDLHYIFSFYGDAEDFEPERMMANVMLALEKVPLLTVANITAAIADNADLGDSDLAEALSKVHVSRELMSIDDFSKVWSIFYQVPYALSLAYRMSHVAIETEDAASLSLPVARPGIWVSPFSNLKLDGISGTQGARAPVTWDADALIVGSGFGQAGIGLSIDGIDFDLAGADVSPEQLQIRLEASRMGGQELAAGAHSLRVLGPLKPDQPAHLRSGSQGLSFAIVPTISIGTITASGGGATRNGTIQLSVVPSLAEGQKAVLLLDRRDPANAGHFQFEADLSGAVFPAATLTFPFSDLPTGDYLARLDIGGFVSPVTLVDNPGANDHGEIAGPLVSIA